jgi:hypothetical protein
VVGFGRVFIQDKASSAVEFLSSYQDNHLAFLVRAFLVRAFLKFLASPFLGSACQTFLLIQAFPFLLIQAFPFLPSWAFPFLPSWAFLTFPFLPIQAFPYQIRAFLLNLAFRFPSVQAYYFPFHSFVQAFRFPFHQGTRLILAFALILEILIVD